MAFTRGAAGLRGVLFRPVPRAHTGDGCGYNDSTPCQRSFPLTADSAGDVYSTADSHIYV